MVMTDMSTHISQISFKVTFSGTSTRSNCSTLDIECECEDGFEINVSEKVNGSQSRYSTEI